ncbi:MAG: extracellular solute-binding protein [Azospirillaceae bacterium]
MTRDIGRNGPYGPPAAGPDGLLRTRLALPSMGRRGFNAGLLAAGGMAAMAPFAPRAAAQTRVNYMGWQGYDTGIDVDGFYEANDITLQTTYMAGNEEIIASIQAGGRGSMDVVTPVASYIPFYVQLGALEPLDLSRLPNWDKLFPLFRDMETIRVDGEVYAVPFIWGSVPLMYNANVVTETPTSWFDMMKPEYKGKVAVSTDVVSIMTPFLMAANDIDSPHLVTREQLEKTVDLLITLKKDHLRTVTSSYGELAGLLASGDVIMAPGWEPISVWAGEDAPPIEWVIPEEGTLTFVDVWSMVADAPNKDAAYTILNQTIDPAAQAKTAEENLTAVTVADAVPMLSEQPRSIYPYDDIEGYFAKAGGLFPFWPVEPVDGYMTYDDILEGWERFLKA